MLRHIKELAVHFRANPLSWLVAVLLLSLLLLVTTFLFHKNVGMRIAALEHDQQQHLQLTGQLLEQRLKLALAELRTLAEQYQRELDRGEAPVLSDHLRALCRQYGDVGGLRVYGVSPGEMSLSVSCDQAEALPEIELMLDAQGPGAVQRLEGEGFRLTEQQLLLQWLVFDQAGAVSSRWQLFFRLASLRDELPAPHGAPSETLLLRGVADWVALTTASGMLEVRPIWQRFEHDDVIQTPQGLFVVRSLLLRDPSDQSLLERWLLVSRVPQQVIKQYWNGFYRDLGLTALVFGLVLVALYLYSRRIIGEQIRMVQALRQKQLFLDNLLDSSPDAMVTVALDGRVESVNARAESLFGYRPGELANCSAELLLPSDYQVEDQDYQVIYQSLEGASQGFSRRELVGIRGQSEVFPVEVTYCRMIMPDHPRLLLTIREIAERKVAEQELDNLRVQYFQQEKMAQVGELMAGILHEVGNPLAAIEGLLEEVLYLDRERDSGLLDDHYRGNLTLVLEQAARIRGICHDVSGFASPRPSEQGLLSLNQILISTTKLLSYDKRWRQIELVMELDDQLPALNGVADQLTQVVMNLLVNAADAFVGLERGRPQVVVSSRCIGSDIQSVTIADNGSGISEQAMQHIFDSFYTTKPKGKGTGLGLSICERLIEEHGGSIEIDSRLGEGTEVRLFFQSIPLGQGN